MGEIENLETKLRKEFERAEHDELKSEVKVDSEKVLQILWSNALASPDSPQVYESGQYSYSVSFSYAEKEDQKGETGVYTDIPAGDDGKKILSMTFVVDGLKGEKGTELQFNGNMITVTPSREYKHILDFELAVLKKGKIK
ncbi:MAG: hypothetical protein ACYDCP_04270 [Thermoplasmataceae archaeon]